VSNAGAGAALIETIEWCFDPTGVFTKPTPYGPRRVSNEMVHSEQRTQVVRHVLIPVVLNPMIIVRVVYFDVTRQRRESIRWVMQIDDPAVPGVSIFVNDPHPEDTYPVEDRRHIPS
jgi:hypothetical protein